MRYLSEGEIIVINQIVVETTGGSIGIREHGLLRSITHKPTSEFGGRELYGNIFLKAAVLYEALVNYHVFIDGNKRTGFASMARFLRVNGYKLIIKDKEIETFTVAIAVEDPDLADIAAWIKKHARKI